MSCLICGADDLNGNEAVCSGCVSRYGRKAQARKRDMAPRNEHDTRVATLIDCTECGAQDRLPFVPRSKEQVLCRNCAAKILNVYLPGADDDRPQEGPDLYERLGVEAPKKGRVKDLNLRGAKPGGMVYKRKKRR